MAKCRLDLVVGTAQFPGDEDLGRGPFSHGFVWSASRLQDLNALIDPTSGWTLETATGVNDSGQIVGRGFHAGQFRPYLLTPHLIAQSSQSPTCAPGAVVTVPE